MTTCNQCLCRPATHDALCGPCAVEEQTTELGTNEGRDYTSEPLMRHGKIITYHVYEQARGERRRFHCTRDEWPNSAAARRIAGKR